jgi:lysophospholipase L1-like esterase
MKMFLQLLLACLLCSASLQAQEKFPYWKEVQAFRAEDSTHFPEPGQVLFVGSSSFTKWTDVQKYFPKHKILNRAFGGSSLPDLIRYRYDILYPYEPKQIVMYCGENDFAASDTVSVQTVVSRFQLLFELIRFKYRNTPFAYVSMKPSPSRVDLMPKYVEANNIIKKYLATKKKTAFIDVYSKMLNADGSPMASLFVSDSLHMNAKGYAIWKRIMEPYLLK